MPFTFHVQVREFKGNTHIRHHCDKRMCYKKRQRLGGSVLKTILHEGKAIFSTKQTNITKQVQWYFYILETVKKQEKNQYQIIQTYGKFKSYISVTQIHTEE